MLHAACCMLLHVHEPLCHAIVIWCRLAAFLAAAQSLQALRVGTEHVLERGLYQLDKAAMLSARVRIAGSALVELQPAQSGI